MNDINKSSGSMKCATLRYALINISYFAAFCGVHAYASVFLLDKGFTNTMIGAVLALANILSVLLQPFVAGLIDKPGRFTNRNVSIVCTLFMIAGSVALFFSDSIVPVFVLYALIYMIQMLFQPLIIAMNFEYAKKGAKIQFGLARGLGSFGFAVTSVIFGRIISQFGIASVQLIDAVILAALLVLLFSFVMKDESVSQKPDKLPAPGTDEVAHNKLTDFCKTYPRFMMFIVGTVCFFFAHNSINDYFIQIITPVGGDEAKMGVAIFVAAALELPTMAGIGFWQKKISCRNLLRISGAFFLLKTLVLLSAKTMTGVYISQSLQLLAYALLIPASAYYVEEVMGTLDKVKGQAYINVAITLGGVFSNLVCGRILDYSSPKVMLAVSSAVCAVGLILVLVFVGDKRTKAISVN